MAPLGWRRLPSHLVNGASVAAGIALVQLLFGALAGFHAAQLASTGAVCVSLADLPNTPGRARRQLLAALLGSGAAGLAMMLLEPWPAALAAAIALIAFAAMMTLAWGPRAGPVAFSIVLAMIFT
ncbi:MAG TPA: FUSC family membrane protein, partial [Ideonella sp.]|nr:FUSC family membrane protein [Ideonella sp.]